MTRAADPSHPVGEGPFDGVALHTGVDLVARGGPLDPDLVLCAYRSGIFPWYDADMPVLWWCPDPRAVVEPSAVHVPRRLGRTLRSERFEIRLDTRFADVMKACAEDRDDGTWIHPEMEQCYEALHVAGHAHSVEVVQDGALVGGIYGVAIGGVFAAESMFHRVRDASKVALVALARHVHARGFELIDVQFLTPHLEQFGCVEIARTEYLKRIALLRDREVAF